MATKQNPPPSIHPSIHKRGREGVRTLSLSLFTVLYCERERQNNVDILIKELCACTLTLPPPLTAAYFVVKGNIRWKDRWQSETCYFFFASSSSFSFTLSLSLSIDRHKKRNWLLLLLLGDSLNVISSSSSSRRIGHSLMTHTHTHGPIIIIVIVVMMMTMATIFDAQDDHRRCTVTMPLERASE